jgi:adenylate kinase
MKIILLGPPGAGKDTQARFICDKFNIPLISTGDMLRTEIKAATSLGKELKVLLDAGNFAPDKLAIKLVKQRIKQPDCKHGYLLDGFPRTLPQAVDLDKKGIVVNYVIDIDVDNAEIVKRITGRRIHLASGRVYHKIYNPPKVPGRDDRTGEKLIHRDDDKEQTVKRRLEVYRKLTLPLVKYYKNHSRVKFIIINGNKSVKAVKKEIFSCFKGK